MNQGNSRQGFVLSILLHASVAVGIAVLAVVEPQKKVTPTIFELVSAPPPGAVSDPGDAGEAGDFAPIEFERPILRTPPPTPAPKPPRVQPKPRPEPPAPVQPSTAKTVPAKPKPAPEQVTYDQFVKQHGAPKTPAKPPRTSGRPVDVPRLSTNFSGNLRDYFVNSDRVGSYSAAEQSVMGIYIGQLMGSLRRVWDVPAGLPPNIEAVVEIDIAPNGRFSRFSIAKGSGHAQFDQSVLDTFTTLGSAGPPPEGQALLLRIPFNLKED